MEMQTGSTNNYIYFVCVSSTSVMVVLVSSTSTNGAIRRIVMLAAPILIDRSMTNYCAGVSGKGNRKLYMAAI
jgi:hypothetical protein